MRKSAFILLLLSSFSGLEPLEEPDILPRYILAFPFGSEDYKSKIISGLENATVWSEKRIITWSLAQGFSASFDKPHGGYQYRRGIVFHPPGIQYTLIAPVTARGDRQAYGWKLYMDFAFFYSPSIEEALSTNFSRYDNMLRYEIYVDQILFKTIEIGYGVTEKSPVVLEIPYIRDPAGMVTVNIRLKNHPSNFGILYDSFLSLE